MTRAARMVYSIALVAGLAAGLYIGFQTAERQALLSDDFHILPATVAFSEFSFLQYRHAESVHAKAALVSYADFLQTLQRCFPSFDVKKDLVFVYTRLAILADEGHDEVESKQWMEKVHALNAKPMGNRSDAEIKSVLKRFDDYSDR